MDVQKKKVVVTAAKKKVPAGGPATGLPDSEPTELTEHAASIASFRDAFEQGQPPGASLQELQQSGQTVTIEATKRASDA